MSEENKTQPTPPPVPVAKTSAVPLKKETVRITLRARPGVGVTQPKELTAPIPHPITTSVTPAGAATARVPTSPVPPVGGASKATAPIQLPSAPLPPAAIRIPTSQVPAAPAPAIPAPAIPAPAPKAPGPPRPPGAPPVGVAPTIPLAKIPGGAIRPGAPVPPKPPGAPVAKSETGAPTVPLVKGPAAPKPPGTGPMGKPMPTQSLPKATVQLAKSTVPMAKPGSVTPPSAPARQQSGEEEYYEEKDPEAGLTPLAVVCMVLALALMAVNLLGTDRAFFADKGTESSFLVPAPDDPAWEQKQPDGTHQSTFSSKLAEVTKKLD